MYVDHKRIIPPLWPLLPALFSKLCPLVVAVQCTSRRHTHASRRERAPVLSHAYATHLSPVRMYALIYDGTPATTTTRGNSVPGAPSALQEGPASRRRPSSSPLLPFRGLRDPPSQFSYRERLVERAAPSNRISNRECALFVKKKKERNLHRRENVEMSDTKIGVDYIFFFFFFNARVVKRR